MHHALSLCSTLMLEDLEESEVLACINIVKSQGLQSHLLVSEIFFSGKVDLQNLTFPICQTVVMVHTPQIRSVLCRQTKESLANDCITDRGKSSSWSPCIACISYLKLIIFLHTSRKQTYVNLLEFLSQFLLLSIVKVICLMCKLIGHSLYTLMLHFVGRWKYKVKKRKQEK